MVNNCCVPFTFIVLVLYCGILVVQLRLRFKVHTLFKCRINLIIMTATHIKSKFIADQKHTILLEWPYHTTYDDSYDLISSVGINGGKGDKIWLRVSRPFLISSSNFHPILFNAL